MSFPLELSNICLECNTMMQYNDATQTCFESSLFQGESFDSQGIQLALEIVKALSKSKDAS